MYQHAKFLGMISGWTGETPSTEFRPRTTYDGPLVIFANGTALFIDGSLAVLRCDQANASEAMKLRQFSHSVDARDRMARRSPEPYDRTRVRRHEENRAEVTELLTRLVPLVVDDEEGVDIYLIDASRIFMILMSREERYRDAI
jgi:hypothetical protein